MEEAFQKVLLSTSIQLEDSWASWVLISFEQHNRFLAGTVRAEHVFAEHRGTVNERGKTDERALMCWFSPWTQHPSSWLILRFRRQHAVKAPLPGREAHGTRLQRSITNYILQSNRAQTERRARYYHCVHGRIEIKARIRQKSARCTNSSEQF